MSSSFLSNSAQTFLRDKQAWENAIASYQGSDPLELWYNFICWYDYNIHTDPYNQFRESLEKCLTIFETHESYKQDMRMIKLWVKYIDLQPNPLHLYQVLYQRGIGTQCANFYIGWAHYYDSANAFKQAESVYNLGFQAKAEPCEELQDAHTKFRLSLSQRMLYNDDSSKKRSATHLNEQRQQITTLCPSTKKIRSEHIENTSQDESVMPIHQRLGQHSQQNSYYRQQCEHQSYITQDNHSQIHQMSRVHVHSNCHSPTNQTQNSGGPIQPLPQSDFVKQSSFQASPNNTHSYTNNVDSQSDESNQDNCNKTSYVASSPPNYVYNEHPDNIFEDTSVEYPLKNVQICDDFITYARNNHELWKPLLYLDEPYDLNKRCIYPKNKVYPGDGNEYSPEEIRARNWYSKSNTQKHKVAEHRISSPSSHSNNDNLVNTSVHKSETDQDVDYGQIEASTIRFSTDSDGSKKNKTITIKFRRDKSTSCKDESQYGSSYIITPPAGYAIDEPRGSEEEYCQPTHSNKRSKGTSSREKRERQQKTKKIKRIKLVNNYDDPKYSTQNNSCSSDNFTQSCISQSSSRGTKNLYEDANLLLTLAAGQSKSQFSSFTSDNSSYVSPDNSMSNSGFNSQFMESFLDESNSSTPYPKTSSHLYCKTKSYVENFSGQSEDPLCFYEQTNIFTPQRSEGSTQMRLEKALATIESHLAKKIVDPFNSELCKAFLTKAGFPCIQSDDIYRITNSPIPKLTNAKTTSLGDTVYTIEKEVGKGSYGSVYKAVNNRSGTVVALKYQKPPNLWEVYICLEVRKRMTNFEILPGFMDLHSAIIAPNASILVTEFSSYGSLLDVNNKLRQSTKKVMNESLVMHFSSQILDIVNYLHSCNIIHADIKPDNFLLMRVPSTEISTPSLRLIDFGCAIDMNFFPEKMQFNKVVQTDGFTCTEMLEGRPWSFQTDFFCIAATIHVLLFGEYMQLIKKFDAWDIRQKIPRYLKKHVWTEFFTKMLNIKDLEHLPNLLEMKANINEEVLKMDNELQVHIRTLSNLLHKR